MYDVTSFLAIIDYRIHLSIIEYWYTAQEKNSPRPPYCRTWSIPSIYCCSIKFTIPTKI